MQRIRSIPFSLALLLPLVTFARSLDGPGAAGPGGFEAREVARLRLHFDSVEAELRARDVSDLTPAQRAARADQIRLVREYSARGDFPRNENFPGRLVPYFRDRHGVLCAMAFLIAASGRGDIVDRVARTRNNAYLEELVDEPGVAEWLRDHGLTVAEAARIQPAYGPTEPKPVPAGYAAVTGGATLLAGTSLVLNFRSLDKVTRHRGLGALGIATGGIAIGLGLATLDDYQSPGNAMAFWNIGVGSVAAILGARALFGPRSAADEAPSAESRLAILPVAVPGRGARLGVAARLRL
jgi:hypothetical protein